jgi:hypothetical protein
MRVCAYVYVGACVCVHVCVTMYESISEEDDYLRSKKVIVSVCVCQCVCACVCMRALTCVSTHTHTHHAVLAYAVLACRENVGKHKAHTCSTKHVLSMRSP